MIRRALRWSLTGALLAGLIVSYLLVIRAGLPVLHPGQEPVEALAVCTKAIEALGLVACVAECCGGRHRCRSR